MIVPFCRSMSANLNETTSAMDGTGPAGSSGTFVSLNVGAMLNSAAELSTATVSQQANHAQSGKKEFFNSSSLLDMNNSMNDNIVLRSAMRFCQLDRAGRLAHYRAILRTPTDWAALHYRTRNELIEARDPVFELFELARVKKALQEISEKATDTETYLCDDPEPTNQQSESTSAVVSVSSSSGPASTEVSSSRKPTEQVAREKSRKRRAEREKEASENDENSENDDNGNDEENDDDDQEDDGSDGNGTPASKKSKAGKSQEKTASRKSPALLKSNNLSSKFTAASGKDSAQKSAKSAKSAPVATTLGIGAATPATSGKGDGGSQGGTEVVTPASKKAGQENHSGYQRFLNAVQHDSPLDFADCTDPMVASDGEPESEFNEREHIDGFGRLRIGRYE